MNKKKILVITPRFPIPDAGACEKDRLEGIKQLSRLRYDVKVIGKVFNFQSKEDIETFSKNYNIPVTLIPYRFQYERQGVKKVFSYLKRVVWPPYWDGAAYEYTDPKIRSALHDIIREWKPDVVWVDYTYLWPLYNSIRKAGIPIITRSINFEAIHFLEEDGRTIFHYLRSLPKFVTEWLMARRSSLVFSITPKEKQLYNAWFPSTRVVNLPLRSMPHILSEKPVVIRDRVPLRVYFMGSTYTVAHNRKALAFVIKDIAPKAEKQFPQVFEFHIFGAKIPQEFHQYTKENVVFHGYITSLWEGLQKMDIAIIPSLYGAGMQQKIFESLARGFPTVVSPRGLAGYPFEDKRHLLCATTADEFVLALGALQDVALRGKLGQAAREQSQELFSGERIDAMILQELSTLISS